jgi:hypothetical protein
MRTKDAVTGASGVWITFSAVLLLYTLLGIATVVTLRVMSRRWRGVAVQEDDVPYGPPSSDAPEIFTGSER